MPVSLFINTLSCLLINYFKNQSESVGCLLVSDYLPFFMFIDQSVIMFIDQSVITIQIIHWPLTNQRLSSVFPTNQRSPLIDKCRLNPLSITEFDFTLFNHTLSQRGHSVSCMTILFSVIANHQIIYQTILSSQVVSLPLQSVIHPEISSL